MKQLDGHVVIAPLSAFSIRLHQTMTWFFSSRVVFSVDIFMDCIHYQHIS